MQHKILSFIFAMVFVQSSFATTIHDQPDVCPDLAAIKSIGIDSAIDESTWGWIGVTTNQYNTNAMWMLTTFIEGKFDNEQDAIKKANANLALLTSLDAGPVRNDDNSPVEWICFYSGNDDVIAITFSPPLAKPSMTMIAKYKH